VPWRRPPRPAAAGGRPPRCQGPKAMANAGDPRGQRLKDGLYIILYYHDLYNPMCICI
jgi:hypothetical protein